MTDKELAERYRMALEAIVTMSTSYNTGKFDTIAIARKALEEPKRGTS